MTEGVAQRLLAVNSYNNLTMDKSGFRKININSICGCGNLKLDRQSFQVDVKELCRHQTFGPVPTVAKNIRVCNSDA